MMRPLVLVGFLCAATAGAVVPAAAQDVHIRIPLPPACDAAGFAFGAERDILANGLWENHPTKGFVVFIPLAGPGPDGMWSGMEVWDGLCTLVGGIVDQANDCLEGAEGGRCPVPSP